MHFPVVLWCGGLAALLSATSCAGPVERDNYESPQYSAVVTDGAFEVRDYPEVVVASAPMGAGRRQNSAFMMLFRYISGANVEEQKIAMTTPVFDSKSEEGRKMSFVVPAEVAKDGTPPATDPRVEISKREAGRFAVYRYSGRWTTARETEARDKLQAWIKEKNYRVIGDFEKASYDPPFTPPSQRRNEVLIRIEK